MLFFFNLIMKQNEINLIDRYLINVNILKS